MAGRATAIARVLFAFLLLAAAPALGKDGAVVELGGAGIAASRLTRESLGALPRIEADVAFLTSKEEERGRYGGVLLWTLLDRAGITGGSSHHAELRRGILVTGRGGYAILFSAGEIMPEFGTWPIMIVHDRNGAVLPPADGFRLIVPGDGRGARSVREVVAIEVR